MQLQLRFGREESWRFPTNALPRLRPAPINARWQHPGVADTAVLCFVTACPEGVWVLGHVGWAVRGRGGRAGGTTCHPLTATGGGGVRKGGQSGRPRQLACVCGPFVDGLFGDKMESGWACGAAGQEWLV